MAITAAARTEIITLVTGMFDAAPGATYLSEFVNIVDGGGTIASLANSLSQTSAFKGIYPDLLTSNEFATKFINNLVGSEASDANKAWAVSWVEAKLNGGASRAEVMVETITALDAIPSTDANWGNAAAALDNQVDVATWYSVDQLGNATDLATLQGVTSSVTSDAATVTAAKAGTTQTGSTFTLTNATDTVTGGAGNDTFQGSVDLTAGAAANTSTLAAADTLKGEAGTDTLNLAVSGEISTTGGADNYNIPAADISGVEKLFVRQLATDGTGGPGTVTVNASNIAGVEEVWSDRSTGDKLVVTNLATGAAIGMKGNGTAVNTDIDFSYATATDAITVAIDGGTKAGTINNTGASATTATVNVTGTAANTLTAIDLGTGTNVTSLTINAAAKLTTALAADYANTAALTVTGAGAVNIGANGTFKTVDASANTGGLTMTLDTVATSVKGSAGNDVLTSAATTATTAGLVDAGAGTDTLVLANATDVDTAAEGAEYVNFETLSVSNNQDVSLVAGITSLKVTDGANALTKLNATQAAAVTQTATGAGNSYALTDDTGTTDALTLNLTSATATTNVDATNLTVNGFETLNINATTGTAGTDSDVSFAAADKLTALNVTGSADVAVVGTNTSKALTLDATAATGAVTVSGNFVNGSTVNTGAGKDAVTLGTGFGTYNTGAGDDTLNGTVAQINTAANYNELDGGAGTDTLNITDGATNAITIVDNNLSKLSNIEKIVITDTTTGAQSITTGGWFDGAFKANGVDLTTASTTGDITIDMTSFTGDATISATTVGTGANEGALDIQTGTGADTITVSAAAAGDAGTVKTYAGNDKITTANTEAFTVTAGAGDDTLVFGSTGVNTAVFENTAALNGVDTITGFNKAADIINWVQGGAETAVTGNLTTTANVFYQLGGLAADKADTAADVAAAVNAAATWTAAAATAWIAVSDDNSTSIYEWTDVAGTAGVQEGELTLVGTVDAAMSTAELATAITIV